MLVTSYETGESGAYELDDRPVGRSERSPADRDVTTLTVGGPVPASSTAGDPTFEAGEYHDLYVFDGDEGETVRIELSSADFDTYLGLVTPSGEEIANDDFEGGTRPFRHRADAARGGPLSRVKQPRMRRPKRAATAWR